MLQDEKHSQTIFGPLSSAGSVPMQILLDSRNLISIVAVLSLEICSFIRLHYSQHAASTQNSSARVRHYCRVEMKAAKKKSTDRSADLKFFPRTWACQHAENIEPFNHLLRLPRWAAFLASLCSRNPFVAKRGNQQGNEVRKSSRLRKTNRRFCSRSTTFKRPVNR